MRRLLTWYLPLAGGVVLSILFGWGFVKGLAGNAGEIVRERDSEPGVVAREEPLLDPSRRRLIVVVGDSLARGTGDELGEGIGGRLSEILDERDQEHEIANIAVDGATTENLILQLERPSVRRLLSEAFLIVVSIGGNDFFGERDAFGVTETVPDDPGAVIDSIQQRIEQLVVEVRRVNADAPVFILGLYNPFAALPDGSRLSPLVARWNASLLERLSDDSRVVIVQTSDLFLEHDRLSADRFHPNGEAYALIARRIADAL